MITTPESARMAESVHEDNARVLQSILDELRMILGLKDGESITAAVRSLAAKPAQQAAVEPFGQVTVRRLSQRHANHVDQYQFYPAGQSPYLDNVDECHTVYTHPAPGVPEVHHSGIASAAKFIEQKAYAYAKEFGYDDGGSLSFGTGQHAEIKFDHYNSLIELADEVRALAAAQANGADYEETGTPRLDHELVQRAPSRKR